MILNTKNILLQNLQKRYLCQCISISEREQQFDCRTDLMTLNIFQDVLSFFEFLFFELFWAFAIFAVRFSFFFRSLSSLSICLASCQEKYALSANSGDRIRRTTWMNWNGWFPAKTTNSVNQYLQSIMFLQT